MTGGMIDGKEITLEGAERLHEAGLRELLVAGIGMRLVKKLNLDDPLTNPEIKAQWLDVFKRRFRVNQLDKRRKYGKEEKGRSY